jgi:hypothetical protein
MTIVKIYIPDKHDSARAMLAMSRHGRVDCYADDTYIVPESVLKALADMGIKHLELEHGGPDFAEMTLRDTLAAHAQRWKARCPRKVPANP